MLLKTTLQQVSWKMGKYSRSQRANMTPNISSPLPIITPKLRSWGTPEVERGLSSIFQNLLSLKMQTASLQGHSPPFQRMGKLSLNLQQTDLGMNLKKCETSFQKKEIILNGLAFFCDGGWCLSMLFLLSKGKR